VPKIHKAVVGGKLSEQLAANRERRTINGRASAMPKVKFNKNGVFSLAAFARCKIYGLQNRKMLYNLLWF